jgi:hypothetical protein
MMEDLRKVLGQTVDEISDQNYERSLAFYRLWFDMGQTCHQLPSNLTLDTISDNRATDLIKPKRGKLIHPTAHLIVRFASDAESDHILAPHNSGLQSRLCTRILQEFFSDNLEAIRYKASCWEGGTEGSFYAGVNLIAHWANLGYVEEAAIRNHIFQSLISRPKLQDHQADAFMILFKLAGATFGAYADPSVVDRCFELLEDPTIVIR